MMVQGNGLGKMLLKKLNGSFSQFVECPSLEILGCNIMKER